MLCSQICNLIENKHKITPKIINSHGFGEKKTQVKIQRFLVEVDKDPRYICKSSPKEHKIKIKKINK